MKISKAKEINGELCRWALIGILYERDEVALPMWSREEMLEATRRIEAANSLRIAGRSTREIHCVVDERVVDQIIAERRRRGVAS